MRRICFVSVLLVLGTAIASAHRLDLSVSADGKDLVIRATGAGEGEPIRQGDVSIVGADGAELAAGVTDENGCFRWQPAVPQDLSIRVYAGLGHKASLDVSAAEWQELVRNSGARTTETPILSAPVSSVGQIDSATAENPLPAVSSMASPPSAGRILSTQNQWGTPERIVLGFIFLLAAVSAWMSYRNAGKLAEIEAWLKRER